MQYERRKEFTALLGVLSVLITIIAGIGANLFVDVFTTRSFILIILELIAVLLAGSAAFVNIMLSQRLSRKREQQWIFLIYAREDIQVARKLAAELREHGFKPWLDVEEIVPGQVWQNAVLRAIEQSAAALVLVSEHISKRGFVQEELKAALNVLQERDKNISPVIPVRLDNSEVPEKLSHIQWVNLFEENGMERLMAGLSRAVA